MGIIMSIIGQGNLHCSDTDRCSVLVVFFLSL